MAAMGQTRQTGQDTPASRQLPKQLPHIEGQQKPGPGHRGRKAAADPSSIAAVLAAHGVPEESQCSSCLEHDDSDCTSHAVQLCPAQLVSSVSYPCIELAASTDKASLLHTLWQTQLKAGKVSARADAALPLTSSQRMMRMQTKVHKLLVESSYLQEQLQVM